MGSFSLLAVFRPTAGKNGLNLVWCQKTINVKMGSFSPWYSLSRALGECKYRRHKLSFCSCVSIPHPLSSRAAGRYISYKRPKSKFHHCLKLTQWQVFEFRLPYTIFLYPQWKVSGLEKTALIMSDTVKMSKACAARVITFHTGWRKDNFSSSQNVSRFSDFVVFVQY